MWQILAIVSALFSASAAVLEKKALLKNDPLAFSLIVSVLTAVFTLPFLLNADFETISIISVLVLFFKSILGAGAFLLVMYGLKYNELSNSLPLLVFTPALVAVMAFFILKENIGSTGIAGMFLLLIGTYFLQIDKSGDWRSPFYFVKRNKAQWFILGAIALFSTTTILDKSLLRDFRFPPEIFLPFQQIFYSLVFLVAFLITKKNHRALAQQFKQSWKPILVVAVLAIVYRYAHILAMKVGPVALVLSIKRTSVFFATIIGGHYFREQNLIRRSISVLVMVAGVIIILLSNY